MPVGVNTGESEFNTVNKTGGVKSVTLTPSQVPSHSHDIRFASETGSGVTISHTGSGVRVLDVTSWDWAYNVQNSFGTGSNLITSKFGGSSSHNNLQPYITCYFWRRTA